MYERLTNGVKLRGDNQGDPWANEHREQLGNRFYLQDLDALFGHMTFAQNTGDRLFLEYVPDTYENRLKVKREFYVVAMFDRKATMNAATCPGNTVSTAFYLWLCRSIGANQPERPRFFYVIGTQAPWQMLELDIESGDRVGDPFPIGDNAMTDVWRRLGLTQLRTRLAMEIANR